MTPPPVETAVVDSFEPTLEGGTSQIGLFLILLLLTIGGIYVAGELTSDLSDVRSSSVWPFVLLGFALLIALGFEFVNGFHDTANAVATVIYTHSMPPHLAVAWSGMWNFIGVMLASGAVAFGIVALLPVELILQVSAGAGFAMVFALLIAAILWNLGTWYLGLPSSSSHALIGSVIGVGFTNQLMAAGGTNTSGVIFDHCRHHLKSFRKDPTQICAVFGPTCDALDTISLAEQLPDLDRGELVYAENMGAYCAASSTCFNGFPPAKVVHVNRESTSNG
ncbi:MAG: inorganic phosphate transporter [Nitrospira sp.]|nr:inorganic phosphate transporter [Nitrospira sp.]